MDTTFTEEQEMLADLARRLAGRLGPAAVPDLNDPDLSRGTAEIVATGLLGLSLPSDIGGSGATAVEVAIVAEAFGRHLVPVPFVGPVLALELLAAGEEEKLLTAALNGETAVTVAFDSTLAWPGTADDMLAWDAGGAAAAVSCLLSGDEWQPVVTPIDRVESAECADLTRRLCPLPGGSSSTTAGHRVGIDRLLRWEAFALSILCADMVGAMEGALSMAVEHAKSRVQFAQPIGSFQAIQHLCADQLVNLEAARAATYYSAWAVDGLPAAAATTAARTAKAYASRAGRSVTEAVLQVHGGIGQTWESLAHVYLRRVLLDRSTLGDEAHQVQMLADTFRFHESPPDR